MQIHGGGGHGMTAVETGGMGLPAKGCQRPLEASRGQEGLSGSLGGTRPVNLDLTPGPQTVRQCDSGFKPLGL